MKIAGALYSFHYTLDIPPYVLYKSYGKKSRETLRTVGIQNRTFFSVPALSAIIRGAQSAAPPLTRFFSGEYLGSIFFAQIWSAHTRGYKNWAFQAILNFPIFRLGFRAFP